MAHRMVARAPFLWPARPKHGAPTQLRRVCVWGGGHRCVASPASSTGCPAATISTSACTAPLPPHRAQPTEPASQSPPERARPTEPAPQSPLDTGLPAGPTLVTQGQPTNPTRSRGATEPTPPHVSTLAAASPLPRTTPSMCT
eukprot:365006-Chlamydomonas_euryale.AAC.5